MPDAPPPQLDATARSRDRRASFAAVLAAVAVFGFVLGVTYPMLALALESRGVSNTMIGVNGAMEALGILVCAFFGPQIATRLGALRYMIASLIVTALSLVSFGLVENPIAWMPLRFILGVGIAGLFLISESWVNAIAEDAHRGKALGIYVTVLAAAFAAGPLLVPVLGFIGLRPYLVCAAIAMTALLPLLLARKTAPALNEGPPADNVVVYIFRVPTIMGAILLIAMIDFAIIGLLPVYALKIDLTSTDAALMLTAVAGGNVVLQYPIGWLADRINRYSVLLLCAFAAMLGSLALPFAAASPWLLWPLLVFWGGIVYGIYTVSLVLLGERYQGSELVAANATSALVWGVGGIAGPTLGGWAMDLVGPHGLPVTLAAGCAIFIVFVLRRHPQALFGR
jgi:MFS family permease